MVADRDGGMVADGDGRLMADGDGGMVADGDGGLWLTEMVDWWLREEPNLKVILTICNYLPVAFTCKLHDLHALSVSAVTHKLHPLRLQVLDAGWVDLVSMAMSLLHLILVAIELSLGRYGERGKADGRRELTMRYNKVQNFNFIGE